MDDEDEEVMKNNIFCNNCRKYGHVFNKCKMPVVSYGVILFRKGQRGLEYLMICRRNTLGYIDFLRGKYAPTHKYYILNMLKQMTREEIHNIETKTFDELWASLWNEISKDESESVGNGCTAGSSSNNHQYRVEEYSSRVKFNMLCSGIHSSSSSFYNLKTMIEEIQTQQPLWEEPEWGFPKGRRHYQESEYQCAIREFLEETGMTTENMVPIYNLFPVEEMFVGSNYKSYKHKYFIMYMNSNEDKPCIQKYCSEVSQKSWKTVDECMSAIRPYNVEKRNLLRNVNSAILKYME